MMFNGEFQEHIKSLRKSYSKKLDFLCKNLEEKLGKFVTFKKPEGGYFIWCKINENVSLKSEDLSKFLSDENVIILTGNSCSVECESGGVMEGFNHSSQFSSFFRLCFVYLNENEIRTGIERIQSVFIKHSN